MASTADQIAALQRENNQMYRDVAREQMDFQERMSNTAHQREVSDLIKAGLNPVLSATGGQGATTPNGAQADVDTQSMVSYLLNEMNNENARAINNAQVAAQRYASEMAYKSALVQAQAMRDVASINNLGNPWANVITAFSDPNSVTAKAVKTLAGMFGINLDWGPNGVSITENGKPKNEQTIINWLKNNWLRATSNMPSFSEYFKLVNDNLDKLHYKKAKSYLNWIVSNYQGNQK